VTAWLAALALGYLLGGFPTAYLLARARGKDVFAVGSGSMGAMNTARNVGPALGAAVLAVDAGKGALAAYLGGLLGGLAGPGAPFGPLASGQGPLLGALLGTLGAVAGHCFSPFVGFRGGKGLATAFAATLVVHPPTALYALALLVALLAALRDSDAAILVTVALFPLLVLVSLDRHGWPREDAVMAAALAAAMAAVALTRLAVGRVRAGRARAEPG